MTAPVPALPPVARLNTAPATAPMPAPVAVPLCASFMLAQPAASAAIKRASGAARRKPMSDASTANRSVSAFV